jgi:hypothetical protein
LAQSNVYINKENYDQIIYFFKNPLGEVGKEQIAVGNLLKQEKQPFADCQLCRMANNDKQIGCQMRL